jgi:hypothetical protein
MPAYTRLTLQRPPFHSFETASRPRPYTPAMAPKLGATFSNLIAKRQFLLSGDVLAVRR